MGGEVLRIKGLSKSFGKKSILHNIDLQVQRGEVLAVIGSSGSGKSTLLKTLVGFYHPTAGDVLFSSLSHHPKGKHSADSFSIFADPTFAKSLIGFASQNPSFYESLTVKENLVYFGSLYGLSKKAVESNSEILLRLMDLSAAKDVISSKLSGGMQRRLDIACAMIHDPEVLILDEPTSDLDPELRAHIWSLVKKINQKGTTIILASHHLSEVEEFASRIAIIKSGILIDTDTPARLKARHAHFQDITVQTYPGDYKGILIELRKKIPGVSAKISFTDMIIKSKNSKSVLQELLPLLGKLDEELVDLSVSRPGLDDLFSKLNKE
jgi:ABC-2 type transport system ATP-binding protein